MFRSLFIHDSRNIGLYRSGFEGRPYNEEDVHRSVRFITRISQQSPTKDNSRPLGTLHVLTLVEYLTARSRRLLVECFCNTKNMHGAGQNLHTPWPPEHGNKHEFWVLVSDRHYLSGNIYEKTMNITIFIDRLRNSSRTTVARHLQNEAGSILNSDDMCQYGIDDKTPTALGKPMQKMPIVLFRVQQHRRFIPSGKLLPHPSHERRYQLA